MCGDSQYNFEDEGYKAQDTPWVVYIVFVLPLFSSLSKRDSVEKLIYSRYVCLTDNITILQLPVVRDKGRLGDIAIHVVAKPNFLLHVNNQATENEDYVLQETIIIMKENIKETFVKVTILPVSLGFNEYDYMSEWIYNFISRVVLMNK